MNADVAQMNVPRKPLHAIRGCGHLGTKLAQHWFTFICVRFYLRSSAFSKHFVSVSRRCISFAADGARLAPVAGREAVEVEVDHRSGEEREELREDEPAHHRHA